MMKGLMDCCMAQKKLVDDLKEKVEAAETGLNELKTWREVQIKKLDVTKKALEESESHAEALKKVLKDKEGEISLLRKQVLLAKEDGKTKFCNSDGFFYELGGCYADGFNECLRQVKALFPDLDISQISINAMTQIPARSIELEGTDALFQANPTPDAQVDGDAALQDEQVKSVEDENHPFEEAKMAGNKKVMDEEAPVDQPQIL